MSIFRNKILVKAIAMLCIFLTIMNFGMQNKVYADWGGVLITPITLLLTSIADGIIGLIHKTVQYQDVTLIRIAGSPTWWNEWGETVLKILLVAVIIVVSVAATIASAGTAAIAAAGIKALIIPAIKVGMTLGAIELVAISITGTGVADLGATLLAEKLGDWFGDTIYMPTFTLTPEEIFSDKIYLFDVNFFAKKSKYTRQVTKKYEVELRDGWIIDEYQEVASSWDPSYKYKCSDGSSFGKNLHEVTNCRDIDPITMTVYEAANYVCSYHTPSSNIGSTTVVQIFDRINEKVGFELIDYKDESSKFEIIFSCKCNVEALDPPYTYETLRYPCHEQMVIRDIEGDAVLCVTYKQKCILKEAATEEETWGSYEGKYQHYELMQVDVCTDKGYIAATGTDTEEVKSTGEYLKGVISKWYFILRNLALLALMLILIYTGIRIVIGSTAGQKAKYKERLMDWFVAVCLLFIMHYIMIFAIEMVGKITELIVNMGEPERFYRIYTS